jgi:hypothetical protein
LRRSDAGNLILLAGLAFVVSIGSGTLTFVSLGDATAETVAASVSVASFFMAGAAILAAAWTVSQQHEEAQAQRQTETMHLLTSQYEALFDDIYGLQGKAELRDPAVIERLYNRYFTILMRGFSAYRRSLVSEEDFEDWTATTIGRFHRGGSILDPDSSSVLSAASKHGHGRSLRELAGEVIIDTDRRRRTWLRNRGT